MESTQNGQKKLEVSQEYVCLHTFEKGKSHQSEVMYSINSSKLSSQGVTIPITREVDFDVGRLSPQVSSLGIVDCCTNFHIGHEIVDHVWLKRKHKHHWTEPTTVRLLRKVARQTSNGHAHGMGMTSTIGGNRSQLAVFAN